MSDAVDRDDFFERVRKRWFPIALIVVVLFGYTLGKDRAERDNARDAAPGVQHDS